MAPERIFSGEYSTDMWSAINANGLLARNALYILGCRCQELEELVRTLVASKTDLLSELSAHATADSINSGKKLLSRLKRERAAPDLGPGLRVAVRMAQRQIRACKRSREVAAYAADHAKMRYAEECLRALADECARRAKEGR